MKSNYHKTNWQKLFLGFFSFLIIFGAVFFLSSHRAYAADNSATDVCQSKDWIIYFGVCMLLSLLNFVGYLLGGANTLFINMVQVGNFSRVANAPTIYLIWQKVRDLLNIAFILVLLFSAFATIFQVEKYSYKKILLRLIIMALLVNFSFPIARFIVDIGNSLMYTLIQMLFPVTNTSTGITGVFSGFAGNAGLANGLTPAAVSISALLASIIFNFMLAVSLLALGVLLTIRTVALVILIILSPIAFVGAIIPDTNSFANKWWDNLFRYTFFGPIMVFMIYIANEFMKVSRDQWAAGFVREAAQNSISPNIVGDIAFFAIPIVLLWMGMGIAQSFSIDGAGTVMGYSKKLMMWGSGGAFLQKSYKAYRSRRDQAKTDAWSHRLGTSLASQQDRLRGQIPTYAGKQSALRYQQDMVNKAVQAGKQHDTANMGKDDLDNLKLSGDKFERAAAILELAARGQADRGDLNSIGTTFGTDGQLFKQAQNKVVAYDPAAAYAHITDDAKRQARITEHVKSNKFDAGKLSADALGNAELMNIMLQNQVIDGDDIEKHRKKSKKHADNIKTSLNSLIGGATDITSDPHKNMQKIYLQQHGKLSSFAAASPAWQDEIFKTGDKDTFKRMDSAEVVNYQDAMARNINSGQFKNIVQAMQNNAARKALVDYIKNNTNIAPGSNSAVIQNIIRNDPYLNSV